jgi:hypothetical protein
MLHIRILAIATAIGGLAALPTSSSVAQSSVNCPQDPTADPPALSFGAPSYISTTQAGGEPVSIVAQDGSILVSTHAGTTHVYKDPNALPGAGDFVGGYTDQTLNFRSTDDGNTWSYVGLNGQQAGPHTITSSGFSDPDYAMDSGGRIYNTEINLANDSVYSSSDDGQSFPVGNPVAGNGDRPWLTGQGPGVVYLYINSTPLHYLQKSIDGGRTFSIVNQSFPATGKLYNDPLNFWYGLIGPDGNSGITISSDNGLTWKEYKGAKLSSATEFFGAPVAVDKAGWIYTAAAGGYQDATDTAANGKVSFAYFNRQTLKWNSKEIDIPTPDGDALWPWVVAGSDGRAAVVWFQNIKGKPQEFYAYAAYTLNAHGTTVTCDDGSTKTYPPKFSVVNASGRPIHVGEICLNGTNCNASPDFQGGDRRLGDFFTVNFDLNGRLFIASADTRLTSPTGSPKTVSNPIFIRQNDGAPLLDTPTPARPTRALCDLPTC